MPRLRIALVVVGLIVLVAIAGFVFVVRGGKKTAAGNPQTLGRYCELATQFDALPQNTGPAAGSVDTSAAAISRLFQSMGATTQEMEADAPAGIHSDVVATVLAFQQAASGNPAGIRSPSFQAHRQHIAGYRQKMCPRGVGANDH